MGSSWPDFIAFAVYGLMKSIGQLIGPSLSQQFDSFLVVKVKSET